MKRPSRFMPKITPRPVPLFGWIFLVALSAGLLYLLWQHPFGTVGCIAALAALCWFELRKIRNRLLLLTASRPDESICTFARAVNCRELDTWIVRAVHEEIQHQFGSAGPKVPLRCSDRLQEDLLIDPDTLDMDLAPDIATRTGRDLQNTDRNPFFGKVETVRDLVLFFHVQPKLS